MTKIQFNHGLIRKAIDEMGFRRKFVAEKVGLSQETFRQYINGHALPSRNAAERIALFLRLKVSDVITEPTSLRPTINQRKKTK